MISSLLQFINSEKSNIYPVGTDLYCSYGTTFGLLVLSKNLHPFLTKIYLISTSLNYFKLNEYVICLHRSILNTTTANFDEYIFSRRSDALALISIIHPRCIKVGLQWCTVFIADFVFFASYRLRQQPRHDSGRAKPHPWSRRATLVPLSKQ